VKLKRIITFTKGSRKKLEIKTMKAKLKNIILSIWIEWWNWKPLQKLQKDKGKKVEIQIIKTTSDNIIFSKLRLNDEIKNK